MAGKINFGEGVKEAKERRTQEVEKQECVCVIQGAMRSGCR